MANATDKIPIICTAIADFENAKLMKSEKAPDSNITGTHDRGPLDKQVALIHEIQPNAKKSVSFTIPVKSTPSFRPIV